MEGLSYVDIFATKGMEYILVIGYLLVLVVFWKILNKKPSAGNSAGLNRERVKGNSGWFKLAEGLFYHQGHSWVMPEEGDVAKVGIDDFAQKLLGKPTSIVLPRIGAQVNQGAKGWQLKVDSKLFDVLSPVDGEVLAVNEEAVKSPELIGNDPYGEGWLIKVRVPKLNSQLKNLISGKLAIAWMEETVSTMRKKITGDPGMVLQDGGTPVQGFAKNISPGNWEDIANEFLLND